ncbi:Agamous-like MADS-box protein agl15, partial [Datura stramonium]|nr:Agamous-like MADS-box protein agl15 [Datura stramonium]
KLLLLFLSTGKLFDFPVLGQRAATAAATGILLKQEQKRWTVLKAELSKLKTKQLRLLGKDLNGGIADTATRLFKETGEELRGLFPLSASLPPPYLEYHHPLEKKYPILKESEESLDSDTACEDGVGDEDSIQPCNWGFQLLVEAKTEQESPSSNSENQVGSK